MKVYRDNLNSPVLYPIPFVAGLYTATLDWQLSDGKYVQEIKDNADKSTIVNFWVDPETPRLEVSGMTMSPDFSTYTISGNVQDTGTGMDRLELNRLGTPTQLYPLTSGTNERVNFQFDGLTVGGDYYEFTAQDKAGNIAPQWPWIRFEQSDGVMVGAGSGGEGGSGWQQTATVANYISEIQAIGDQRQRSDKLTQV